MENPTQPPPFVMPENEYNAILKSLMERRATVPCSRCGGNRFELQPTYTTLPLVPDFRMASSYGGHIPCAIIICNNCGNINLHSLGALGLLQVQENPTPEQAN